LRRGDSPSTRKHTVNNHRKLLFPWAFVQLVQPQISYRNSRLPGAKRSGSSAFLGDMTGSFRFISNVGIYDELGHGLTGMIESILGLPTLSSVCGYVRSFSRYEAKRDISPFVGVAAHHRIECWQLRVQVQYDAEGGCELSSLLMASLHFHPFMVMCDGSRENGEKVAFHLRRDLFCTLGGICKLLRVRKRTQTRHNCFNSILTYF